jgi:hypothetical protein
MRLWASADVPTALLALEVQRGRIPGAPGGAIASINELPPSGDADGSMLDNIANEAVICLTRLSFLSANYDAK